MGAARSTYPNSNAVFHGRDGYFCEHESPGQLHDPRHPGGVLACRSAELFTRRRAVSDFQTAGPILKTRSAFFVKEKLLRLAVKRQYLVIFKVVLLLTMLDN